jgi:predicted TIM-barrel fold metal-dependent hydrolase
MRLRSCLAALLLARAGAAQTPVDSALLRYVQSVRAIDVHAHPMRPVPPGAPADSEYDALPLEGIPTFAVPHRLTLGDPVWGEAQRALYQVAGSGVAAAAERARRERGAGFPAWALDRAGIDVMLANRIAMGPGLAAPRFRWVPFVDPLMYPLDTRDEAARTPDTRALYPREERLLHRFLHDLGRTAAPATLDAYERDVVLATLRREKAGGAVGVKFEAAYLRPLDFDTDDEATARDVYARFVLGGVPSRAEYKTLQDHLFRAIVRHAGRLGLTVQIHVLETFGGYYASAGAAPRLLEPALNDSTLRGTRVVIVHGGWPLVGETSGLLAKPNVWADVSMMDQILSPTRLAAVLRQWLSEWPDKVLFGTDAFDGGAGQGWEQVAWVGSATARRALAVALTGMMRDGEITRARAEALARMVLRENALKAYSLGG